MTTRETGSNKQKNKNKDRDNCKQEMIRDTEKVKERAKKKVMERARGGKRD